LMLPFFSCGLFRFFVEVRREAERDGAATLVRRVEELHRGRPRGMLLLRYSWPFAHTTGSKLHGIL